MTGPRPSSSRRRRRLTVVWRARGWCSGRRLLKIRRTAPQFHENRTLDMATDVSALETLILYMGEVTSSHFLGSGRPRKSHGLR